jgi:hypothetical protein
MNLEFRYETPTHDWAVLHVFNAYHRFLQLDKKFNIVHTNLGGLQNRYAGGVNSAQILMIKNIDNKKYILVSYWDNVKDLVFDTHGWDPHNCVEIITSSGPNEKIKVTPFSYLTYSKQFHDLTKNAKPLKNKKNNDLFFKGYLYGVREQLAKTGLINISSQKTHPLVNYFNELSDNRICLSFNGAGEICNRDIEILGARSVLLRPALKTKFYNELKDGVHYISFKESEDPIEQCCLILDKFKEIKNDNALLKTISENGYEWYLNNGSVNSNVGILKKIINLEKIK